ncbi:hypothetical protein ACWPMX_03385 [Tsuneonella sp. HG094]|jgi:hypothetical protein
MLRAVPILMLLGALSACRDDPAPEAPKVRDPQVARALDDPLMTDPDLASRNEAAAALRVESDSSLPVLSATPEFIAAARAEAAALTRGAERFGELSTAPGNMAALASPGAEAQLATMNTTASCRAQLQTGAIWAARMPTGVPIYPRGAVQSAAGLDAKCRVRAITYTAPIPPAEMLAFYAARTRLTGLSATRHADGTGEVLRGGGNGLVYDVRIAPAGDGSLVRLAVVLR